MIISDNRVLRYIREQLSYGGVMAHLILDSIDLNKGIVIAYLPENIMPERQIQFEYGGVSTPEGREKTADFVLRYLQDNNQACAVFEEVTATADNQTYIQRSVEQIFTCNKGIYYFLTTHDKDKSRVMTTLRKASDYPGIGILTFSQEDLLAYNKQPVLTSMLPSLVNRTKHILIDAYDGDQYIIWSKTD